MDMWLAIALICTLGILSDMYKRRCKMRTMQGMSEADTTRIERLEKRVESLETIVLDYDKERRFQDLERSSR